MAATDLLTLAEAKTYLSGLVSTAMDAKVQGAVAAVTSRIEQACGAFVQRPVTETVYDIALDLTPSLGPIASVTTVVESVSGNAATLTSSDYRFGQWSLTRVAGGSRRYWGGAGYGFYSEGTVAPWNPTDTAVTVTYVAGRVVDTASVPGEVKYAAGLFLQHLWRPSEGGGSETYGAPGVTATGVPSFGIPNVVRDLLTAYLRPPAVA
jgi:hypothetical protein